MRPTTKINGKHNIQTGSKNERDENLFSKRRNLSV